MSGVMGFSNGFLPVYLLAFAAGFAGGIVRGYCGFGFALAAVPVLTLAVSPVEAVPAVLPLELAIGAATFATQREHARRELLGLLCAGTLVGTPLGIFVLASTPAHVMKALIGVFVLVGVAIILLKPGSKALLRRIPLFGVGLTSGLLNGSSGMSGPPAIVALLGSDLPAAPARATLMAFIAFSAFLGIVLGLFKGFYTPATLSWVLLMLPGAVVGGVAGVKAYSLLPQNLYRPISVSVLFAIAVLAITGASAILHVAAAG